MPLTTRYGFADIPLANAGDPSLGFTDLSSSLSAIASTASVTDPSGFPALVQFPIIIGLRDSAGSWSNVERAHCTSLSGSTLTITRTAPIAHASGEKVSLDLNAASMVHNPGPMTDTGDFAYLDSAGRMARLAAVATGNVIISQGVTTAPVWGKVSTAHFASANVSQWTNDAGYLTSVSGHAILSTTHTDTLADAVVRGDILYGNSTPKWARLPKPSVLSDLSHDGTDVSWVTAIGTGAPVRAVSPVLTTPVIGVATGTSLVLTGKIVSDSPTFVIDEVNHRVGIGTATPSVPVHETPAGPVTVVTIGGATEKANHLLECTITDTSTTNVRSFHSVLLVNLASNPASTKIIAGIANDLSTSVGLTTNLTNVSFRGLNATATHQGTGTVRDLWGGNYTAINASTGIVTNMTGIRSSAFNQDAGGTVTNYKAFEATAISNVGTFVNTYGFYCGLQTSGTQTNKPFAFYNADPDSVNFFAGATVPRVTDVGTVSTSPYTLTPDTRYCNVTQINYTGTGAFTVGPDAGVVSPQPYNLQSWTLKIKSTNAVSLVWNAMYTGALLGSTTGGGTTDYFSFLRDTATSKWHATGNQLGVI